MLGCEAESVAQYAIDESGLDDRPRCDPSVMAAAYCGLVLAPWPRVGARLVDGVLWYPSDEPPDAVAYYIAHEVGHDLLAHAGYHLDPCTEERAASRIAAALLLPRRAYLRDLRAYGWDLQTLAQLWPLASPWVHARRISEVAMGGAIASRWDTRGRCDRVVTEGIEAGPVSCLERHLASAALAGEALALSHHSRAWPVDGGAIVVCSVDELVMVS